MDRGRLFFFKLGADFAGRADHFSSTSFFMAIFEGTPPVLIGSFGSEFREFKSQVTGLAVYFFIASSADNRPGKDKPGFFIGKFG
jgi:hypothetical protein